MPGREDVRRGKLDGCRRSAFESIDRPAMKALPASRYEVAYWKKARVNIDYHVMYDDRPYSVPHAMVGAEVQVRATVSTVEILHKGRRVIAYQRCWGPKGTPTTLEEHRPKSHRDYGAWPPSRVDAACRRALAIGSPNRKSVEMTLKRGLEHAPMTTTSEEPQLLLHHENVRGSTYFDRKESAND